MIFTFHLYPVIYNSNHSAASRIVLQWYLKEEEIIAPNKYNILTALTPNHLRESITFDGTVVAAGSFFHLNVHCAVYGPYRTSWAGTLMLDRLSWAS